MGVSYLDTFRRAERGEATLESDFIEKHLYFTTPPAYAQIEARTSAQRLEEDRMSMSDESASAQLARSLNPQTVAEQQKEIRKLEFENNCMREALKDLAYGAVMMIAVTDGATRKYVREVYRVAMAAVGGARG